MEAIRLAAVLKSDLPPLGVDLICFLFIYHDFDLLLDFVYDLIIQITTFSYSLCFGFCIPFQEFVDVLVDVFVNVFVNVFTHGALELERIEDLSLLVLTIKATTPLAESSWILS